MAKDQAALTDAEARRAEAIAELDDERGNDWREHFAPGTHGCHELLDRVALIARLIDEQILEHPACLQDEQWYQLAYTAGEALNTLYQAVGAVHLDDGPGESDTHT